MRAMKRGFPLPIFLLAFLSALLMQVPGLWLLLMEGAQPASVPDFSLLLDTAMLQSLVPGLKPALAAALVCLLAGFPAGCLMALWRGRTAFMAAIMPVVLLAGSVLVYIRRMLPYLPEGIRTFLFPAAMWQVDPAAALALGLLPLALVCVCGLCASADPALYESARDLGASRLKAYFTFVLPRTLLGAAAGFFAVLAPAAGVSLALAPGVSFAYAAPALMVLMIVPILLLALCRRAQKKPRRFAPC